MVVSIGMTNGESKMASNNAPNGHRWIQLIKLFSQSETSVSQFHREFFTPTRWWHKFQPWEPLKSCETNLPAAVSCSHVFVNWAISVNFWNWVDRLGTGASFQLHRIAPFVHFRVKRLSHGLMSHGCSFKDWYWTTVTQIMSHKRCHVTFRWNQI